MSLDVKFGGMISSQREVKAKEEPRNDVICQKKTHPNCSWSDFVYTSETIPTDTGLQPNKFKC